jgi:transglutaminase-like putative cysteine protease
MTLPIVLRLALYALVADGVLALYVADFIGARGALLVGALLAAAWCLQPRTPGGAGRLASARLLVPLAALASAVDIAYLTESVLDALVRLLLFLILYKLATLQTVRDSRTVAFLAFFMLVAASGSAFGVGFLFAFVGFVALLSWIALLQHFVGETAADTAAGSEAVPHTRYLLGLAGAGAAAVFLVAAGLFFVLPRVGIATLPLRARLGQMITGFSERVELGSYGSILTDSNVVMRVHLPDEVQPDRYPNLRWRGIVLDTFDGQAWSLRYPRQIRLVRPSSGGFDVGLLGDGGQFLRQEIFLEPISSEVVFAAPRVLRLTMATSMLAMDDMGAVSVSSPGARLRYTVESEVEGPWVQGATLRRSVPPLDANQLQRYLQLPALAPAIPALARQVAGPSQTPEEIAHRVEEFLRTKFRYTLDIERVSKLDPLQEFLFVRRAGHCEYFAAAMAVMLRTLGVPSRVVNGFQRGEWNPYGQYYIVRYYDAHSWVEAFMPGAGWVTFDPTPRAMVDTRSSQRPTLLYLDSLRLQWHRYVVNWTLRDQIRAVQSVQFRLAGFRKWSAGLNAETRARLGRTGSLALVGAIALVGAWAAWRHRRGGFGAGRGRTPAFYRRALQAAARRGLRPTASETAREFSGRVAGLGPAPGSAFTRVTALYERARFGGTPPDAAEVAEAEASLAVLGHKSR